MVDLYRAAWFIHESNAIEGEGSHSRREILRLLQKKSEQGHVGAFRHLLEVVREGGLPRKSDLLYAHGLLMCEQRQGEGRDCRDSNIGCWRNCRVQVGTDTPPEHTLVPALMSDLEQRVSDFRFDVADKGAAVNLVAEAHHAFLKIHPFTDGNGRISRLYANALLSRFGLPLAVFTSDDRFGSYYQACSLADSGLMRTYLRAKIANPKRTLSLDSTAGWLESLPQKMGK